MRISDWSSDVCSSDLPVAAVRQIVGISDAEIDESVVHVGVVIGIIVVELVPDKLEGVRSRAERVQRPRHSALGDEAAYQRAEKIGRASCRGRVCQYV